MGRMMIVLGRTGKERARWHVVGCADEEGYFSHLLRVYPHLARIMAIIARQIEVSAAWLDLCPVACIACNRDPRIVARSRHDLTAMHE